MIPFIRAMDKHAGNILAAVFGITVNQKKEPPTKPKNIAVIQLWGLGETLLTLPAIKALKEKYKTSITVICTKRNKTLYQNLPFIDNIQTISLNPATIAAWALLNKNKYDLVIDFEEYLNISALIASTIGAYTVGYNHGSRAKLYNKTIIYNDQQHCAETFADLVRNLNIKIPQIKNLIPLPTNKEDKKAVEKILKENNIKAPIMIIAPGAAESGRSRIWPQERFSKLADAMAEKKYQVAFIGTENENDLIVDIQQPMQNKSINLAGKTNLHQLAYLLKKAKLMIGNDSGPMHLAAAMGTKTMGLFGPNLPVRFRPIGKNNKAIYKATCPCSPCINVHLGQIGNCIDDDPKCIKAIQVEDVVKEI